MQIETLEKLNKLKENGVITQQEFDTKKKEILENEAKQSDINNFVAWGLAFAPHIGCLLHGMIGSLFQETVEESWYDYWGITTLILNIGLSYWDASILKTAGYNSKILDNCWFVPGYLWERAKLLKNQPIHFWIWLGCFISTLF